MRSGRLDREEHQLKDGRNVVLRSIREDDAARLIDLHGRLSSDTQYLRFFGPKPELTSDEAAYLAGVDFDTRFAIVASVEEGEHERLVAVGRFDLTDDDNAECAIVVRDDYQSQGLGTAILSRLVDVARGRGLKSFSGEVLPENTQMLSLLKRHGMDVGLSKDAVVNVHVDIERSPFVFDVLGGATDETGTRADQAAESAPDRFTKRRS